MTVTNVAGWLLGAGAPEAPALLAGAETLTHGELRARAERLAAALLLTGVGKGDRVGLLADNSPFFVEAYLAIMRAGACAVPLSTDVSPSTLARIAGATAMRLLLAEERRLADVREAARAVGLSAWNEPEARGRAAEAPARVLPGASPGDLAALMFTSGSTGEPKGVMVTHANLTCNTRDIVEYLGLAPSDRALLPLPLFYCFGASVLHSHLAAGASVVLAPKLLVPELLLDVLERRSCTGLAGVPSTYQLLLRKTRLKERRFPSLRWVQQAGGRLPPPVLTELAEALPGVRIFVMYGQTEATARLSYLPPELLGEKLGSIGRGLASVRLAVLRDDGTPVTPGSGEVGEIVASGDSICGGYWGDEAETARYFRDGRLFTGDLARVDADGFLFLVERARDMVKSLGHRVSPKEVEDVIAELPEVVEAAVIGVPDPLLGEALAAFVVPGSPSLSAEAVREHCNRRLPNYKVPQRVELVPSLPKSSAGKVLKGALRERSGGERAGA